MPTAVYPEPGRPSREQRASTKQSLSLPGRRLVEEFQSLNFGYIRDLRFRAGEPLFDPLYEVVRTIRLPGNNLPRPEQDLDDFVLKREIVEFFHLLSERDSGLIEVIKIQNGLPVQLEIVEHVAV
jgi:hypothetical protein